MSKTGKTLSMRVYVTGENLEKLERIINHLNGQNDVLSGDADRWTKSAVYQQLFNDAIENFKL